MSLAKAYIHNVDTGELLMCMFNPKEYTFSKSTNWTGDKPGAQSDAPSQNYTGGQPTTLKMQLFFDTYHLARDGRPPEDVRKKTEKIWALMYLTEDKKHPKTQASAPPKVRFGWGSLGSSTWTFDAYIESISQQFTMFMPDGLPVRAVLDVSFKQLKDEHQLKAQNPTSGGLGGERVWTVQEGDSLARIAHKVFGNGTQWRSIAEVNGLNEVRDLEAGQVLIIPV